MNNTDLLATRQIEWLVVKSVRAEMYAFVQLAPSIVFLTKAVPNKYLLNE